MGIGAIVVVVALVAGVIVTRSGASATSGDRLLGTIGDTSLRDLPRDEPQQQWSVDLRVDWIADLTADARTAYIAVADGEDIEVLALDLRDGGELWREEPPGEGEVVDLTVADGSLIVVRYPEWGGDDMEATVSSLDARTGGTNWDLAAGDSWAVVQPLGAGRALLRSGGYGSEVAVISLADGERIWWSDGDLLATDGQDVAFLDDDDLEVRSITGDRVWSERVGDEVESLALSQRLVLILDDDELVAYGRRDGAEVWTESVVPESPHLLYHLPDSSIWVIGRDGSAVVDEGGTEVWAADAPSGGHLVVQDRRTLIVDIEDPGSTDRGRIYVYDAATGDRIARTRMSEDEVVFPGYWGMIGDAFAAGAVMSSEGRSIRAYELETLDELWEIRAEEEVVGKTPAGGGLVVVSIDRDGEVFPIEFFR